MSPSRTRHFVLASLIVSAACDDARMSVRLLESSHLPNDAVRVVVSAQGFGRVLRGNDLGGTAMVAPEFDTPTRGTARVRIQLAGDSPSTAVREIRLALQGDWIWGVDIRADSIDPSRTCFGCVGSRAFPLPVARQRWVRDSLWVIWGGNSISNPVVY